MSNETRSNPSNGSSNSIISILSNSPRVSHLIGVPPSVLIQTHNFMVRDNLIKVIPKNPIPMGDKVYAFDLDSTLIKTRSGGTFSKNAEDWKWCFDTVLAKLEEISKANGTIVIFSNQAGVLSDKRESKSMYHFLLKVKSILLDLNKHGIGSKVWIYASTGQSALSKKKGIDPKRFTKYRKPAVGMFEDFEKEYNNLKKEQLKNENVVFIGDAAGREGDFSDSDLKFAKNCRVEFRIPEDFF